MKMEKLKFSVITLKKKDFYSNMVPAFIFLFLKVLSVKAEIIFYSYSRGLQVQKQVSY